MYLLYLDAKMQNILFLDIFVKIHKFYFQFSNLVDGQSTDQLGGEDLLSGQFVNNFGHIKFRERLK